MGRSYLSAKEVIHRWHPLPFVRVPMEETSRKNLVSGTRCKGTYVRTGIQFCDSILEREEEGPGEDQEPNRKAKAKSRSGRGRGGEDNEETSAGEAANDLSDTVDR